MATTIAKLLQRKINWRESYTSLILGAIIVIILGLLVANFFSKRNQQIGSGEQTSQSQEAAMAPKANSDYTIRENDSLSKISEQVYGSQEYWPAVANVNNIANANVIWVGNKIKLPAKEELDKTKTAMAQTTYEVKGGDTLFTIAEKVYGDGSKWVLLDRANGSLRLANGNPLVYSGSTIVVPR